MFYYRAGYFKTVCVRIFSSIERERVG